MNRPELFKRSVDVLAKAYRTNTLIHIDCARCAVGNLLHGRHFWYDALMMYRESPHTHNKEAIKTGLIEIAQSGYTIQEIDQIEDAFMDASSDREDDDDFVLDYFYPLMAVIDVLLDIHDAHSEEAEARNAFAIPAEVPA